jgi:replication factor C subunit 3/5
MDNQNNFQDLSSISLSLRGLETSFQQDQNDFLPWVEKYRPKTIDEIISHAQNIETIKKLLIGGSLPHLLFHGSSGTGKTSTIMALAKEIYGNNIRLMVMKLDASDDRGINSVREDIKGFAEKSNMFQKGVRLIILDEADSMTFDAQFALRRIIEKYSATIRFCLICNYENKIIPAIRSRCANFRFSNIDIKHICIKLNQIAKSENLKFEPNVIETIATLAKGDLRKAINLIQSISMQTQFITNQLCWETAGIPSKEEIIKILETLNNNKINFDNSYQIVNQIIKSQGYSLSIVLKELIIEIINNEKTLKKLPQIISDLSDLENMVTKSTFGDIYITSLVGIFKNKKNSSEKIENLKF